MNLYALKKPKIFLTLIIWLVAAVLMLQTDEIIPALTQFAVIIILFSWFFLNRFILDELKASVEVILFSFIVILFIDLQLVAFYKEEILAGNVPGLIEIVHQFFLAVQILLFSLVIIGNNNKKQRVIFIFLLLALLGHFVVYQEQSVVRLAFYFLLFFILLKYTVWMDSFHKKTLGFYFLFFVLFFFMLLQKNPFTAEWKVITASSTWFTIPHFLYDLLKLYTLAMIVKIPAVIIYNHMTLSRKLWFSGVFQSIIPQIFQFILLVTLFFFFISGWQAKNLQEDLLKGVENGTRAGGQLQISDALLAKIGSVGVIKKMQPKEAYYFFMTDSSGSKINYYQNVDSFYCKSLWDGSQLMFGNGLIAYPFKLLSWEKYLDKIDVWQRGRADKISPFPFMDAVDRWYTGYYEEKENHDLMDGVLFGIPAKGLSFGRVSLPLYNMQGQQTAYFAFDIMFNYKKLNVNDPMVGMVLAILLIFFLFNSIIIRRVSKAGDKINKTIISKFENLKVGIREIAGGNLKHKLKLVGEDEFVELSVHFNQMGEKLEQTIIEAREKDRLDQELSVARDVQLSLLKSMLPDIKGYDITATLETAQEVSGDFYDVTPFNENKILFTIGDVSGKGTSAAFYMAQFISLFRFSAQFTAFPAEIAQRINEYFTKHVEDRHIFITAIIGVLDLETDKITLIRAGHNAPYLIGASGEVSELMTKGIGIGLTKDSEIFKKGLEKVEIELKKDEKLFLYTDGLNEATRIINGVEEQYGDERLSQKLSGYGKQNATHILSSLIRDVNEFFSGQPKNDDLTLLIIQKL